MCPNSLTSLSSFAQFESDFACYCIFSGTVTETQLLKSGLNYCA